MTKRLIDIDDDLLARAGHALGTSTMVATVREALHRVTATDPGEAYVGLLRSLEDLEPNAGPGPWRVGGR